VSLLLKIDGEPEQTFVNLLSEDHSHANDAGDHCIFLEPYGYRWYRVGGLDYLLKRSDVG
jgi:maltose alpha-D-glucosyltransferase/alpha-amylase